MKYLLDTNIISEMQKSNCNQDVRVFIEQIPAEDMFVSAITMGELCYGMEKLPPGKKKHELAIWLYTQVAEWFRDRVIALDTEVLMEWGKLRARADRTLPVVDSQIAAAAITHHMTLITRNVKDFEDIEGINLINPWGEG
jgi:predicted nucleic acid-binding protein